MTHVHYENATLTSEFSLSYLMLKYVRSKRYSEVAMHRAMLEFIVIAGLSPAID